MMSVKKIPEKIMSRRMRQHKKIYFNQGNVCSVTWHSMSCGLKSGDNTGGAYVE